MDSISRGILNDIFRLFPDSLPTFKDELEVVTHLNEFHRNHGVSSLFEEKLVGLTCSEKASVTFREKGNVHFKKLETMDKAVWYYSRAIYSAPNGSPALPLAHGNRAAALFKLEKYDAANYDCERALELKHPGTSKILFRQAAIARAQRDASALKDCIEKLEGLETIEAVAVDRLKDQLEAMVVAPQRQENPKQELNYKGLADGKKISIMRNKRLGRCVVAEEPINENELIFVEEAFECAPANQIYSFVFLEDSEPVNLLCDYCLDRGIVPFPCYACRGVFYCSRTCQESDASLHAVECGALKSGMFPTLDELRLTLRCLLRDFDRVLGRVKQFLGGKTCESAKELWSILLQSEDDEGIFGLHSDIELLRKNNLKFRLVTCGSLLISDYLFDKTGFPRDSRCARLSVLPSDSGWPIIVSALLLRLSCKLSLNAAKTISYRSRYPSLAPKGKLHKFFTVKTYLNIVHVFSGNLNHSCDPNVVPILLGSKAYFIAKRAISPGEELRISYIIGGIFSYAHRRQFLLDNFGFCCDCNLCERKDDSALVVLNRVACREGCGALFVPEYRSTCPRCESDVDPGFYNRLLQINQQLVPSISSCRLLYREYQNMCRFTPPGSLRRLVGALTIIQGYLDSKDLKTFDDQELNGQMLHISIDCLDESAKTGLMDFLQAASLFMDVLAIRKDRNLGDDAVKHHLSRTRQRLEMFDGSLLAVLRNYHDTYLSWISTWE